MANIQRQGTRYKIRWREHGRARSLTVSGKRHAERLKIEIEEAVEQYGRYEPRRAGRATPLELIFEDYIRASVRAHQPNTTRRYAQALQMFGDFVGPGAIAAVLTYTLLGEFHAHLSNPKTGRHLHCRSRETCRKHLQVVEHMWRWAWQRQARGDYVGIPQPDSLGLKRHPPAHQRAPTWAHMDAMIAVSNGWQRRVYVLLRSTGLRVNHQVMQLRWDDIDLDNAEMRIRPELGKSMSERRGRQVPIAPWLVEELAGWGVRDGYVSEYPRTKREARARDAQRAWKRAGVPTERWTQAHHCFRKGFQSGLKRLGADDEAVTFLCGQKLGGVRDHYVSPDALPLRETVALIPPLGGHPEVIELPRRGEGS